MINLSQHGVFPRDLLVRRLEALTGRRIEGFDDRFALDSPRISVAAGADLLSHQPHRAEAFLVVSGVAADARILPAGRRQILGLRFPGDIVQGDAHDTVSALTAVELIDALPLIRQLSERGGLQSGLGRAWMAALRAEQAMLRDHIIRLGRLSAYERLAHLLVETHERLFHVGLANGSSFHLPLRQEMIADLLGLSVVHVSRTSQQLKRDHLAQSRSNYVTLLDRERLIDVASYTSRFAASLPAQQPRRFPVERTPLHAG